VYVLTIMDRMTTLLGSPPTDARAADTDTRSHRLMLQAGLIREAGRGLWSWLPAGWRVHEAVVRIVREELERIGAQEVMLPVLHPADHFRRWGRLRRGLLDELALAAVDPSVNSDGRLDHVNELMGFGELFRLADRQGEDLLLAISHELVVVDHVADLVASRDHLPLTLYQVQTKLRDERRPRGGVLRTREFVMADSYSFDADEEGLDASYARHMDAYERALDRCGIAWHRVDAAVGTVGSLEKHEYMAPCAAGEDLVALAPGYAVNAELATAEPQPVEPIALDGELETPPGAAAEQVAEHLGVPLGRLLVDHPVVTASRGLIHLILRADHRLNDAKLVTHLGEPFRPARPDELPAPAGNVGPSADVPVVVDRGIGEGPWVVGGNRPGLHRVTSDLPGERADLRWVEAGDTVAGGTIRLEPAIEVGNIVKPGTLFTEPFGGTYTDESARERTLWMGCYGMGPARIVVAAIEQLATEHGIVWPRAIAPWDAHVLAEGRPEAAEEVARELERGRLRVIVDDRPLGRDVKLRGADLLGCPVRVRVGPAGVEAEAKRGDRRRFARGDAESLIELWGSTP
jgi:prolyl-tRNA synthetase